MNLDEFSEAIRQEVLASSADTESGHFREDRFTELFISYLESTNEIDGGEICYHKHNAKAEKLNAFSFSGDSENLDLFVCFHTESVPPENVPNSVVKDHFRWLRNFLKASLNGLYQHIEESSPQFDAVRQIFDLKDDLARVRLFFLTDGVVKSIEIEDEEISGISISHVIWDIDKLHRVITSKTKRGVITVDFKKDFDDGVPCIASHSADGEYSTLLAYFSGNLLARLYAKFGPRLLEKNVRSFLQAKGSVNKGIRKTLQNEPSRFLAYNNGISATASRVTFLESNGNPHKILVEAEDFQIVNGGQTTASIHHAFKKDKMDLSKVGVQVKITVLADPRSAEEVVPLISRYANSQNKINAADFSANLPYHMKLEEASRRLWAPAPSGTEKQTHWYYERARGSYLDDKFREVTPARIKAFEAINPLRQKFTKTDLAKFENTWNQMPHFVCLGAEKNFIKFGEMFSEKGYPSVDERYFQRLIAKAILFRSAEKIVSSQEYGGFRANIVTYTLSWIFHYTAQQIDLDRIWKDQAISGDLEAAILTVSTYANEHITNPPPHRRNPGEWSKRVECWDQFKEKEIKVRGIERTETGVGLSSSVAGAEARIPEIQSPELEGQIIIINSISGDEWRRLASWAKETQNLQPWQRSLAFSIGRIVEKGMRPSAKQAKHGTSILEEARRLGFREAT